MSEYVSKFNVLDNTGILVKDTEGRSLISDLDDRKVEKLTELVFIGDSFGTGWQVGDTYLSDNNKIPNRLATSLKLNLHNYSVNGAGYTISDNTFYSQGKRAINDSDLDNSKVKYVVVLGIVNDINLNPSVSQNTVISSINTLQALLLDNFPNAFFYFFTNWASVSFTSVNSWRIPSALQYANYCERALVCTYTSIVNVGYPDYINSDNIHPNSIGAKRLAHTMSTIIAQGQPSPLSSISPVTLTAGTGWDVSNLLISMDRYFIHFMGSVTVTATITSSTMCIGTFKAPFTFYGTQTFVCYRADNYDTIGIQINPPLTDVSNTVGSVYITNDNGNTLYSGAVIAICCSIPRIPFSG